MFRKFKLRGNRPYIRTEEELLTIDKDIADEAFKKNKKIILDKYLLSNGFVKYKTNAYVRKNKIDVLEYIDIQKERYGSRTFTVNFSIMPLYVPHDYLVISFGDRLGKIICDKDVWWDYAGENVAQDSFQNVVEAIERFVLPWFEKYSDETYLVQKLQQDKIKSEKSGIGIPYKNKEWINALEEGGNNSEIISANIDKLKLPKKYCM